MGSDHAVEITQQQQSTKNLFFNFARNNATLLFDSGEKKPYDQKKEEPKPQFVDLLSRRRNLVVDKSDFDSGFLYSLFLFLIPFSTVVFPNRDGKACTHEMRSYTKGKEQKEKKAHDANDETRCKNKSFLANRREKRPFTLHNGNVEIEHRHPKREPNTTTTATMMMTRGRCERQKE